MAKYKTEAEKQLNRERVRARRLVLQALVRHEKEKPCTDCGVQYPYYVMQFDHVRGVKKYAVASIQRGTMGIMTVKAEIAKCEVVCANCHAIRTWTRRQ